MYYYSKNMKSPLLVAGAELVSLILQNIPWSSFTLFVVSQIQHYPPVWFLFLWPPTCLRSGSCALVYCNYWYYCYHCNVMLYIYIYTYIVLLMSI
jgi:hypothetical protein